MKEKNCSLSERLGKVGGQAVLEGVMMKAGTHTVTTCRKEDGSIVTTEAEFVSVRKKHKWLNAPILRGVVNFVEMMKLSFATLGASAEAIGLEETEGRFEKWMKKHLGLSVTDLIMVIGMVLGVALSVALFMFLPAFLTDLLDTLIGGRLGVFRAVIEGGVKICIFLAYLWLIALMPDIRRTFMYHGAEHKSIACFEAGVELTPENAKSYTRFHPRCGTSFMFFMILIGVIVGLFIRFWLPGLQSWQYFLLRLLLLPIVVGIGYEFILFAGKHNNFLVRALSAPGLWVQRITTREPTEDMLEIAIISLKGALREEYPDFRAFYDMRPWEPSPTEDADAAQTDTDGCAATEPADEAQSVPTEQSADEVQSVPTEQPTADTAEEENT